MIPYVGSPQRGEPTYETPYTKSQTPLNGPNNTRSIMANSPITDVIFDFCGVLLDWNTRACLEGRFPDEIVERICADDDPCGFFRYEDRMDTGEDFADIYPDVVREQGQELADIFKFYIGHYADALPRTLPGMVELLADLKAHGYGVWGLTNWSHETFHLAFEKYPRLEQLLQGTVVSGVEKMHKRIFNRPIRTESIAITAEFCFADWFHDLLDTLLYQPVPNARDSQWSGLSVRLRDFFSSYASGGIAVCSSSDNFSYPCDNFIGRQSANIRYPQSVCSRSCTSRIRLDVPIRQHDIFS